jgi:hypothetical protein
MATKQATIQVVLQDNGTTSIYLDGKETHSLIVSNEQEFIDFVEEVTKEYAWWIAEAWRYTLDEIEYKSYEDDDDEDSSLDEDDE